MDGREGGVVVVSFIFSEQVGVDGVMYMSGICIVYSMCMTSIFIHNNDLYVNYSHAFILHLKFAIK